MANNRQTTNYLDLILPKGQEYYSVQDGNTNFIILDTKIEEIVNSITSLNTGINNTIEKVVADLIGGATEGIDSLKDILDLLNDPESGELVKINQALNERVTLEQFDEFKTEHTKVHDTINNRLTAMDDKTNGSIVREQTARKAGDDALDEKIGSLELLKTTNKEDVISSINELVGNIGPLTSLTTDVKTSIVNAINSNKTSIDSLKNKTTESDTKNGFYFYNLKNVLLSTKDNIANLVSYSKGTIARTWNIKFNNLKMLYYGRLITINQTYTMSFPVSGSGIYTVYIGMQIDDEDYDTEPDDVGYIIGKDIYGTDLKIKPNSYVIGDDQGKYTPVNYGELYNIPDDNIGYGRVVYKQPLIRIEFSQAHDDISIDNITWVNDATLPSLYDEENYDYISGIYNLITGNISSTINSKADSHNVDGGFTGGSSASTDTGGAIGNEASSNSGGGAVGEGASATFGGGAVGKGASATFGGAVGSGASEDGGGGAVGEGASAIYGGGAVGEGASADLGGAVGNGASATSGGAVGKDAAGGSGFAGGYKAQTVNGSNTPIDAIQLGTGTNSNEKTLQVYSYQLMDVDGQIPTERMKKIKDDIAKINLNIIHIVNQLNISGVFDEEIEIEDDFEDLGPDPGTSK